MPLESRLLPYVREALANSSQEQLDQISESTEISIHTILKIRSGAIKSPNVNYVERLAIYFGAFIDVSRATSEANFDIAASKENPMILGESK